MFDLVVDLVLLLLIIRDLAGLHVDHRFDRSQILLVEILHLADILTIDLRGFCLLLSTLLLVLVLFTLINCPFDGARSVCSTLNCVAEEADKARSRFCD